MDNGTQNQSGNPDGNNQNDSYLNAGAQSGGGHHSGEHHHSGEYYSGGEHHSGEEHHHSSGHHHHHHHHHRRKRLIRRILIAAAVVLLVILLLGGVVYTFYRTQLFGKTNYVKSSDYIVAEELEPETYTDEDGEVQTVTEAKLDQEEESEVVAEHQKVLAQLADQLDDDTETYNLLLIGVDRRDRSWYGNSDVMLLVTVNNERKTIYLTSFLRDLYANIPEVGVRKLNASCAYGGPNLCVETIRSNYGVQIDNYAMVDFYSMADIIDEFGGVDLEISAAEAAMANSYADTMIAASGSDDYSGTLSLVDGMAHLDGYHAVGYARNRYTGNTYDFGRTERQRKVLMALAEKAKSGGLGSLSGIAKKVLPYVTHNIDELKVLSLLSKLPTWADYKIEQQHIPYDNMYYSQNEILVPDMEATITKLRETIY